MNLDVARRVRLKNESNYSFGSTDNVQRYPSEVDLTGGCQPSSIHGIFVDDEPVMVVADSGGASGIHANSFVVVDSQVFVAVGAHVVCFVLGSNTPSWSLRIDDATCFGVYYRREKDALISHGELNICRFTRDGKILWSEGGADIFSEGIELRPDFIEVLDFGRRRYRLPYG